MPEQLQLIAKAPPVVSPDEVATMIGLLRGLGWTTASQLICLAHEHRLTLSDRKLRAIASASEGQIISGQNGYKLTLEATIEEVQHSSAWLRHQAGEMTRRAVEIDRVYHRKQRDHATPQT